MAETNQNFDMYQGETKNIVVPITKQDGTALDLTGSTITWALRKREGSTINILVKSTPSQISINSNTLTIPLIPSDTVTLEGTYYHECKMVDTSNDESILFTGYVTIMNNNL